VNRMQTYVNWQSIKTKMERDRWQTIKGYFVVEKASSSSHKTGCGLIQHIFSWTLVKAADYWRNTLWFFWILTCSTTLLSIFVKVWNVNVNFCVHTSECLLTENMHSLIYFRLRVLQFRAKVRDVFMRHPVVKNTVCFSKSDAKIQTGVTRTQCNEIWISFLPQQLQYNYHLNFANFNTRTCTVSKI